MLIDKDDAIQAICEACYMYKYIGEHYKECKYYPCDDVTALEAVPEAPSGDLISRADAIRTVHKYFVKEIDKTPHEIDEDGDDVYTDMPTVNSLLACNKELSKALKALPSAEAEPTVIRSRTLMPTKDFKEWAKRIREVNPNAVVIPCDAEVVSAEEQGEWIDIDNYYRMATCSHCHKVTMFEKWGEYTKPYDFCPNCGARMTPYKGGDSE